jgi:predicted nucleotidyltransferase
MDLARPYSAISPGLVGDVLVTLVNTTRPMTGREVARVAARGSARGVLSVLDGLVEQGLVDRAEAGTALLYTLNRDHVAAEAALALAGLRTSLVDRIRDDVERWPVTADHVSLFGSFARGDGGVESDVDLFVVRAPSVTNDDADWRHQLDGLARRVERWSGNRANVAEIASDDLARLRRERPPIVTELLEDAVVLAGAPVSVLFEPEDG